MVDENPYKAPEVDESKWFTGGHLGGQIQQINWQVAALAPWRMTASARQCHQSAPCNQQLVVHMSAHHAQQGQQLSCC